MIVIHQTRCRHMKHGKNASSSNEVYYNTVTEGHEYEVIKEGGRKDEEEFALKECPAYVTAPRGGAGEVANTDGRVYETITSS